MGGKVSSLSDEAFNTLLERLEVSILKLSELEFTKRIDTEYYRKKFLKIENRIRETNHAILGELGGLKIGPFGSAFKTENYVKDRTYRYIRGKDVKPLVLMEDDNVYMPKADYYRLEKYALQENDVLVSVVGTLGNAAIINKQALPAIFSCKSTAIRVKSINPFYLLAYFNSFYGRELLIRKERGAIQKGLNLDDLKRLEIFIPSSEFQNKIEFIFKRSYQTKETSKDLYTTAEAELLAALGLSDYQPSTENVQVKSLKDSFLSSGRFDAEYFQPKYDIFYDKLIKVTSQKKWKYVELGTLCKPPKYGSSSKLEYLEKGVPFLRIADLNKYRFNLSKIKHIASSVAEKEKGASVDVDDILISRSGTLGLTIVIPKHLNNAIFGSYFIKIVLNKTEIRPQYLALYLNSIFGKTQIEQANTGGIQTNITIPTIQSFKIVLPPIEQQEYFEREVLESYHLEDKSKQLLHIAKTGVEKAIENSEAEAMAWMEAEITKLQ